MIAAKKEYEIIEQDLSYCSENSDKSEVSSLHTEDDIDDSFVEEEDIEVSVTKKEMS